MTRPEYLKLEFAESTVLSNISDSVSKFRSLRELGVRLAIDDFGSGHSSLSCMKRLPLVKLKIGQSFVQGITSDCNDALMVEVIIYMANSLQLKVIAEGVETEGQLTFLKHQGCEIFQGFYFGKPTPLTEFEAQL